MIKTITIIVFGLFCLNMRAQLPNYVPTNGLIGYWPFNGNANDASGNSHNGTVIGASLTQDRFGNANNAYSFSVVGNTFSNPGQYIEIQNSIPSYFNTGCTISAWINPNSLFWSGNSDHRSSIVSYSEVCVGQGGLRLLIGEDSQIETTVNFDTWQRSIANNVINTNSWTHVVSVIEAGTIRQYVNGNLVSTFAITGTPLMSGCLSFGENVMSNGHWYYFDGKLDDIGIWDRALTPQEITNLNNGSVLPPLPCVSAAIPTNGLVAYYPFCGNANDESGNANNGTVNGALLSADRFGNINSSYSFDGLNDYISSTPVGLPIGSSARTVSAWFNTSAGAIATSQYPNIQTITGYGNPLAGAVIFPQFVSAPSGKGYFESGSSQNQLYSNSPVNDGNWHLMTTTYNGANSNVKLYIDGQLQSVSSLITLNTASSYFGIGNSSFANIPFQGKIDDIGIWNRELTPQEITDIYNVTNCTPNTGIATISSCNPITWIDGNVYSASNTTATHVLTNAAGCDSTVTLNFTRKQATTGIAAISSCNPITWIDGNVYSSSNTTATHIITNVDGCDSTVTLNFTRKLATTAIAAISSCNPITWIDGNVYSTSNTTATHVLTNAAGCDSTVTLNFTRKQATTGIAAISSCNPITWIDGNVYSSSNTTATHVLTNAAGCDSAVTLNFTRKLATTGVDVISSCNPITWIDGNVYSTSNTTATHVLTNAAGCDSTVTLNFTRKQATTGIATISSCNPITWIDGNVYSASNTTATHVLTNAAGCDSAVTLNFTRKFATTGVDIISSCNPITWIDGIVYSANNTIATHVLTNAAGCDSTVTLNFTRKFATTGVDIISSCNPITWIDGIVYSANNTIATHVLTNAAGCDSTVTLNFTRKFATTGVDIISSCNPITWIDGIVYSANNTTATHVLTNAAGCDSTVTLNFTKNNVDVTTTTINETITANAINATYQWLDCDNGNSPIANETNQSFTATTNGNYAVKVIQNGCTDTSACVNIATVGISNLSKEEIFTIYPNPTNGQLMVTIPKEMIGQSITIINVFGQVVNHLVIDNTSLTIELTNNAIGIYFIRATTENGNILKKIVKQ